MQLIQYETAIKAKEVGFNEPCENWYRDNGELFGKGHKAGGVKPPVSQAQNRIIAPYQSQLQEWLRKKHGKHILIDTRGYPNIPEWIIWGNLKNGVKTKIFKEYKEALEYGLYETLKLIKP
jgi:hypothetical protein